MRPRAFLAAMTVVLALSLALSPAAPAEVVGHITQVEGRVDLLKGGKLPATPVALQDKVESGDVLRSKSLSKAQITFIDNSVITLSPESRLAVDEYRFDPGQQKRNAVLNLFQGMAHVIVNKLYKVEEPDFVIKTHTAVAGVRGTDFGVRLHPNSTTVLNFDGVTQVGNIFPEISQQFRRAAKVAFAWGGAGHFVTLKSMQGTTVGRGLPPTLPFAITQQDRQQFMNQLGSGLMGRRSGQGSGGGTTTGSGTESGGSGSGTGTASTDTAATGGTEFTSDVGGLDSGLGTPATDSTSITNASTTIASQGLDTGNSIVTTLDTVTIPPLNTSTETPETPPDSSPSTPPSPPPPPPPPTPQTYSFTQTTQSTWTSTSTTGTTTSLTTNGWGVRTGITTADPNVQPLPASYTGYFSNSSSTGERTVVQGALFPAASTGVSTSTLTGTVTGLAGGTLTGTGTMTGTGSFGQIISFTGTVTIDPSGLLTFTYGGVNGTATITSQARLASATGTTVYTPGAYFTQALGGAMSNTASDPYSAQSTTTVWGGTTTTSGPLAQYYAAALTGGQISPWAFAYMGQNYDSLGGTVQGVVSGLQGAATITPTPYDGDSPFVSVLPTPPSPYLFGEGANATLPIVTTVNVDPGTGVLSGTVYTTDYQDGKYASGVYSLTQTPQPSPVTPVTGDYNFTETYTGAFMLNSSSSGAPGTTNSFGYGLRSGTGSLASYYNGWFASYDNGNWTATSGSLPSSWYGSALSPGSGTTPGTTLLSGSVSGTLGQPLTGNMTWIGSLLNGASFNYQGTVTLDSDGYLKFVYGGSSGAATWIYPGGASGTAAGEMWQWPGYYFTQTMPGTYQLDTTTGYNGTLTLAGSSGTRSMVYGGSLGPFSGLFNLYSESGSLPPSSSGTLSSPLSMEGVVGNSWLGANSGAASLTINTSPTGLSVTVPGQVSLNPGGTNFLASGVFVPNNTPYPIQVSSFTNPTTLPTALTQLPLYSFSETYNGFRIGVGSTPFTLASVEGYGWGSITGTGATPLPTSYTGGSTTGYFVSQDLGTRASLSAMTSGWAGVTGSFTATVSGTSGQTLTGQMLFTGTNSLGATLNYQGNVTLASNGTLVWNYCGTWTNPTTGQTGTASGNWTQVLGTYFTETVNSGAFVQAASSTTIGSTTYASKTVQDAAPLGGTRTVGSGPATSVTTSYAGIRTSQVNTFSSGSGTPNLTVEGVVAGSTWETRWGVATVSGTGSPANSNPTTATSGPVTLDPTGKLTGQFANMIPNGTGQPVDNVTVNYVSVPTTPLVPTDPQQTTSSFVFVQTVPGTVTQTPTGATPSTQGTLTTPTPLSGTSSISTPAGLTAVNVNANVALSTTAASPTYVTAGPVPMTAQIVGAVGGPAGGPQTGVASMHSLKGTGANTRALQHLGTATHQPAAGTTPATLTVNVNGLNPAPTGVAATQTGTVTVTPKP